MSRDDPTEQGASMSDHAQHKRLVARFLARMAVAPADAVATVLAEHCHADCV